MPTITGTRSPLFYKSVAGGLPAIIDTSKFSGNIFFVDSGASGAGDTVGHGSSPDAPFATIDYAIGRCVANQGDVILVLPGHAETVATLITADIAGIKIVGLGVGNSRPALTVSAVIDGISITAEDVLIENLRFVTPSAAATSDINIAAARAIIRGCRFEQGANLVDAVTITAAGEEPTFEDNEVIVAGNGPDCWLKFEGVVDRPVIERNKIIGSDGTNPYDDGMFDFFGQAVTNLVMRGNDFIDGNQAVTVFADGGAVVGELIGPNSYSAAAVNADNTGVTLAAFGADSITAGVIAANAIDAGAIAANAITDAKINAGAITAAKFAAGAIDATAIAANAIAAGAIAADAITNAKIADNALATEQFALSAGEKTCDGVVVTRATAALPQGVSAAIFTVTGAVLLKRVIGYVTITVGAVANATKLKSNSTGVGATTDLCATVEFNNAVADSRFEITGTLANAMVKTVDIAAPKIQATEVVLPPGTVDLDCAGSDGGGGRVRWSVTYVPLEAGAQVVAA